MVKNANFSNLKNPNYKNRPIWSFQRIPGVFKGEFMVLIWKINFYVILKVEPEFN